MTDVLDKSKFKFFNDKEFYITLIDENDFDLNELDWNNPNYVQILTSYSFIKSVLIDSTNFFNYIGEYFKANETNIIVTDTISEEPLHTYQIMYIDKVNNNNKVNQFATLMNINGDVIQGKAIIIKNYVATLTSDIRFDDMDSTALYKMIKSRGYNTVGIWDSESEKWKEDEVYGPIENYAKNFFEEEPYKTCEIGFLKHNLNILYLNSEYGKSNVCGKLLNGKVEKVLIFTMLTDSFRGNITKEEIEKIIKLSTVLTPPFKPDNEWLEEKRDEHDRIIINNKYRILDNIYQENFKI
jgi:hypothetical protein